LRALFRSTVDVLRRAPAPMTAREIAETLIAGVPATRKQFKDLQAAILAALHDGITVVREGSPGLAVERGCQLMRPSLQFWTGFKNKLRG
jgi:hypothetical protein